MGVYQTLAMQELDLPSFFNDLKVHGITFIVTFPQVLKYIVDRVNPLSFGITVVLLLMEGLFGFSVADPNDQKNVKELCKFMDEYILDVSAANSIVSGWLVLDEPEGHGWKDHPDWAFQWVQIVKEHDPQHRKTIVRHSRVPYIFTGEDEIWAYIFGFGHDYKMWGTYDPDYANPEAVTVYIRDYALPEIRSKFGKSTFVAFGSATYPYWVGGYTPMDCKAFTKEEYELILKATLAFPNITGLVFSNYYGQYGSSRHDQSFYGLGAQAWEAVAQIALIVGLNS